MKVSARFRKRILYAISGAVSQAQDTYCEECGKGNPPEVWDYTEKQIFDMLTETERMVTEAVMSLLDQN